METRNATPSMTRRPSSPVNRSILSIVTVMDLFENHAVSAQSRSRDYPTTSRIKLRPSGGSDEMRKASSISSAASSRRSSLRDVNPAQHRSGFHRWPIFPSRIIPTAGSKCLPSCRGRRRSSSRRVRSVLSVDRADVSRPRAGDSRERPSRSGAVRTGRDTCGFPPCALITSFNLR